MKKQKKICQTPISLIAALVAAGGVGVLQAAELVNNETYQVRWDNTIKYQVGMRTQSPSSLNMNNPNSNDGTGAFDKHDLITNRVDLLTEFDFNLKDEAQSGFRISASAWYDNVYTQSHQRISENYNQRSVDNDAFTAYAKDQAGRDVRLLDAFVHSGFALGDHYLSWRAGQHTLIWGESLFFAGNGIAGTQAPIDAYKAASVPSALAKEVFMPVNQVSTILSLSDQLSLEAYYQLEFQETLVPAPGTYWSAFDGGFRGGESLFLAPGFAISRADDLEPSEHSGQWGLALKYRDYENDLDYGLYYTRHTAKTPQTYVRLNNFFVPEDYLFVYQEKIETFGASVSSKIGNTNVAAEISLRDNMPLTSNGLVIASGVDADGRNNPAYAVGQTLHAQVSSITVFNPTAMWDSAALTGEFGLAHLHKVTKNDEVRNTRTVRTATGVRGVFEPTWFQAFPGTDLKLPVSLGYNFTGLSAVDPGFNGGAAHGGDVGVGLKFTFENNLRGGISYAHYIGEKDKQAYNDRDFVMFDVAYSF